MTNASMKLTVGAIPYFWPRERVEDFYGALCGAPVDRIYLGETVCSKRRELAPADWLAVARELKQFVPEVVLSTLTLIEAGSELSLLKRLAANGEFMIEANDLAAVQLAIENGIPFFTGPNVNIYNGRTLALLAKQGLHCWVPPVELSVTLIADILAEYRELSNIEIETEIFAYGRLPLAHSARCFTARHHDRPKDACGFVCLEHPEGLRMKTRENEPFLRLNGIQVQSDAVHCVRDIKGLKQLGVNALRLSPTGDGFLDAVQAYAAWLRGEVFALEHDGLVDGYWYGEAGMCERGVLPGA